MATLTDYWNRADAAKPLGWRLEGLRCASTGLVPEQRSDRWLAEACGPQGECLKREAGSAQDALISLTEELKRLA